MSDKKSKVFVAMSGGVDSSVAAALLLEQGYDCHGVFMLTHDDGKGDAEDARNVAKKLDIPIDILDFREHFTDIIDYFCNEYSRARTPNPCVYCNRVIKFGKLWDYARENGADFIATGHYIRSIKDGEKSKIYTASNQAKEQSYILSMVNKDVIDHILFPIGDYAKDEIRQKAGELGLGIENKPDSQEICFIPDDDYISLLEEKAPHLSRKGKILYSDGSCLGEHEGVHRYTIGQRRGLGIAMGEPVYVVRLDAETNTVVLGEKSELFSKTVHASNANWLIDKPETFEGIVKIRYNDRGKPAKVYPSGNNVTVEFDEPVSAATPGQTTVFYMEDAQGLQLVGGAWIDGVGELAQ